MSKAIVGGSICLTAAMVVLILMVAGMLANPFMTPPDGDDDSTVPTGTEFSKFSFPLNREDTSTATSGMTSTVWWDENNDGRMQTTELRGTSDSSGTYTTLGEYPIGDSFTIWIQSYGTNYDVSYTKVSMSGSVNPGGSAKSLDEDVYIRYTDDSVTYDGQINNKAWDDSSDYNYTAYAGGQAEVAVVLSAADKGISSNLWEAVDYEYIYGIDKNYEYWLKWDQVKENGFDEDLLLAPNFFCIYMTVQDKIDLTIDLADFDIQYSDGTNWYCIQYVTESWGDLMYNTADSSAPQPTVLFDVDGPGAAGTTVATYGVGIVTGATYSQMMQGTWTKSTTYYLGTPGNDWDWVA